MHGNDWKFAILASLALPLPGFTALAAGQDDSARLGTLEKLVNDTRIGGRMYVNLSHIDESRNGANTGNSGAGLDVKRFYLTVDHKFDPVWSANLTTDFEYLSNDGITNLFVKKAYVQADLADLARLRIGAETTPWLALVDDWYGYRYIEKTLIDRTKFGNSADWGVHLLGGRGILNYQVSVVNGAGYKRLERADGMDFTGRVGVQPIDGLMMAVGAYTGHQGAATKPNPAQRRANRYNAMVAWNRGGLRLGGEWFEARNWGKVTSASGDKAAGWSLWGSYDFGPASAFGRYDRLRPSKLLDPDLKENFWQAGLAFSPAKGVQLAAAYKDTRQRNFTSIDLHRREIGLWSEVRW